MAASLDGVWGKVRRADAHLRRLQDIAASTLNSDAIRITVERDVKGMKYLFYIHNLPEPDASCGFIAGDCIHNLRSALDHLAFQLAIVANGGNDLPPETAKNVMFPIFDDPELFKSRGKARIAPLRPQDKACIKRLQPYNAWDKDIWATPKSPLPPEWGLPDGIDFPRPCATAAFLAMLEAFENTDKHRTVHPTWYYVGGVDPPYPTDFNLTGIFGTPLYVKNGAQVGRWDTTNPDVPPIPPHVDVKSYFPMQISLGEIGLAPKFAPGLAIPMLEALTGMLLAVSIIVTTFEPCIAHGADPAPLRFWDGSSS